MISIPSRRMVVAALVLLFLSAGGSGASGADRRSMTELDLFRFVWVADPEISPDGSQVAFVRVTVDAKREGYDTAVWVVDAQGGAPRAMTSGKRDSSPRWAPDGKHLLFLRGDDDGAQLELLNLSGGEARALTHLPHGAHAPAWSPDGHTIAFSAEAIPADFARQKAKEAGTAPERESDVKVFSSSVYRANGAGWLDPSHPSHLWTVTVAADGADLSEPHAITHGGFEESNPTWSPDGATIYFSTSEVKDPSYETGRAIFSVPVAGGEIKRLTTFDGDAGEPVPSPDGKWLAFQGHVNAKPLRSYDVPHLFVVDSAGKTAPRDVTASLDADVGGGVGGDQRAPRGGGRSQPIWSADGRSIYVVVAERGSANLRSVDVATGKVTPFDTDPHDAMSFTGSAKADRIALVISTPVSIGDLFVCNVANKTLRRLTQFNEALWSEITLTPPEEITYKSFDGREIQAWVQRPPHYDPHTKYPLILNIHGGPHAAYGATFDHEFQWMAAKGYIVLYPNPRGSTSYGQEFGNLIQHRYPGDDYKDLMAGVDLLVNRGEVDPKKLGITGGSGGGVLTNWAITQTHRFAAAVSQRSISDWASWWYTADFTLFHPTWFKAAPFEDPADFSSRSAITFVKNVTTPLMLIEGDADYRTPPTSGGEQMYRALKYLHRPVVMVRFPGESHELSRSGRPWHRVERLQHIVRWFDKYLMGDRIDLYDVP
jgi:dipeptidyl aminopeptidase/acylaminoacyl peptidase